ncbi:hypothetical protein TKK_0017030 [Trichogramma kaykai]
MPAKRNVHQIDEIDSSIGSCKKGMSLRSASTKFEVPYSTLKDKKNGRSKVGAKSGPGTTLTTEEENGLQEWILAVGKAGFPSTPDHIANSVQKIVTHLNRPNRFTNNKPGRAWMSRFLKQHSTLTLRTPQNLTQRRADITEMKLRAWFKEVQTYLKEHNVLHIEPNRIFNCDETAALLNPKDQKVVVNKKKKSTHAKVGSNDKERMTVLVTGNAAGQLAPCLVMYAYQRLPPGIIDKAPKDWALGKSESGWMTSASFYEYMSNIFLPWVKQKKIKLPIILYLDGHSSHMTLHLSDFCAKNQIILVALYPNSTHITQPMDVGLFSCLKKAWRKTVTEWRIEKNGQPLDKIEFAIVFKTALESIDLETVLRNSFKECGLSPFNADALKYEDLFSHENNVNSSGTECSDNSLVQVGLETLSIMESFLDPQIIEVFKNVHEHKETWCGEEKYSELYRIWSKWKECATEESIEDPLVGVQEKLILSLVENEDIDIIIDPTISSSEIAVSNISSKISLIESCESDSQTCEENFGTSDGSSQVKELQDKKQNISDVFKDILFYPQENAKSGKRQPKEKVPAVVSGTLWRKFMQQKVDEKKSEEKLKEERKILREVQAKIKVEKKIELDQIRADKLEMKKIKQAEAIDLERKRKEMKEKLKIEKVERAARLKEIQLTNINKRKKSNVNKENTDDNKPSE